MTAINLTLLHGDTYMGRLAIFRDGEPADLTGCTLKVMLKLDNMTPDDSASLTLTIGSGLTILDTLTGSVDMEITAAQSAALNAARSYVWDLQVKEQGGRIFTACGGTVMLTHDVVLATA